MVNRYVRQKEEPVMSSIAHVGIDWHEATLRVVGLDDESKLVIDKTVLNDAKSIKRQFKELSKKYTLRCCYEAGAGGYVLYRLLTELKIDCSVIAPSLVPTCAGDRIKTDRRDAIKLARGQKNGDLVRVYTPTTAQERDRRLTRSRASTVKSVTRIKNEILKLLTSVGVKRPYRSTWTGQHLEWLRNLSLEGSDGLMLKDLLSRFDFQSAQLVVINGRIEELSKTDPYREYAGTLMCLKGIALVSSMVLLTEIIDFNRFGSPRQLMAYLGLIPSEESSGDKRRQGAITKCGNARCRGGSRLEIQE
jgi:transposase